MLGAAFEMAATGLCCCDSAGRIERANSQFCALTGYPEAELTGLALAELVHPEDRAASHAAAGSLGSGRLDSAAFECRVLRKPGDTVWARITFSLARDPADGAGHLVVTAEDVSERKRQAAEEAAHARRSSDILANISDGYITLDRDWVCTEFSERAAALVGRSRDALISRNFWDLFPDAKDTAWHQCYREVMETGVPAQIVDFYPAFGRWYSVKVRPFEDGISLFFNDVTDQVKLQSELRAGEARLLSIQHIARVGSWELDLATMRVNLDKIGAEIYGVDADAFDGSYEAFIALVDPADRDRVRSADSVAMVTGAPAEIAYRIVDRRGRLRYVIERTAPGFDDNGRRASVRAAIQDVTELRRNEIALRERESLLRQGAQLGRFGTWVWDLAEARCRFCSEEMAALLEMTVDEYLRERGTTAKLQATGRPVDASFAEALAGGPGQTYDVEFQVTLKSGVLRHFREIGRSFWDEATGHMCCLGVTQDITLTKIAEFELQRLAEESARLARLAEGASRAKSEFLAAMSHELRTPLNAVIGFSEVLITLESSLDAAKIREYHHAIRESGQHLLSLINDILDLAKVEAGRMEVSDEVVDLRALCAECIRYLAPTAGKLEVSMETEILCDRLKSDRRLLKQILLNLMSNAVKFNRKGGKIVVQARRCGAEVVVTVTDTGIGMNEMEIARALHPFVQLESAYQRTHEGSGLGLALVERFARLLGGRVDIRSETDRGTTVSVVLPFLDPAA